MMSWAGWRLDGGNATTFFSYSWNGTLLADLGAAADRALVQLGSADAEAAPPRFLWLDMLCASQNLLAGKCAYIVLLV